MSLSEVPFFPCRACSQSIAARFAVGIRGHVAGGLGRRFLVVLGLLTVLSLGIGFMATALGAKVGASKLALIGAVVGTFAGLLFGAVGLLAGPLVGALGGELIHGREVGQATRVGFGT